MQYTVSYELDGDGWWVAKVRGVAGCHTQGRTIDAARRRIREALSLYVEHAERADLVDRIRLPARARGAVARARDGRARAEKEQERANAVTREAIRVLLSEVGLSVRDAATVVGLSHQRVQQLAVERRRRRPAA